MSEIRGSTSPRPGRRLIRPSGGSLLVRIALEHARRQGWINHASPVALVGDHPNDIRAARAHGVRSIAVATGLAGADELAAHSPDVLVPDMRVLSVDMLLG